MYRTLTSALALCLLAVPASAACIQSDLAGQFRVYALDNERVTYCTVVIESYRRILVTEGVRRQRLELAI
jgi:hypothetical protein